MSVDPMYCIYRVDSDVNRMHGFRVAVQRNRKVHNAWFSDYKYKTPEAALAAARAKRDAMLASVPVMPLREYCSAKRKTNKTGYVGVTHYVNEHGTQYWIARCPTELGKYKLKKFSTKRYGFEGALERAKEAREHAMKVLLGDFNPGLARKVKVTRRKR